jgi:hypothetical protein
MISHITLALLPSSSSLRIYHWMLHWGSRRHSGPRTLQKHYTASLCSFLPVCGLARTSVHVFPTQSPSTNAGLISTSATLVYFGLMTYIVLAVLNEIRPMWYYILSATLFVLSQLAYFLLSKVICKVCCFMPLCVLCGFLNEI